MGVENLGGQTLGQYELRDILGAGGMGIVYRGYQAALRREVAIKVLTVSLAGQQGYLARFNREAQTSAALEHLHIVPIYDYGTMNNISYIVMRLLMGGTLAQRLTQREQEGKPMPSVREVGQILKALGSALDYAHKQGVIHRDIKTSNVMLDSNGSPYLVDFGIARLSEVTSSLTGTSMTIGTPSYMSPEQWRGDVVVPSSDQYALGVLIYATLTGRMPFEATTPYALMHKHINETPIPVSQLRPEISPAIDQAIERAMAKTPEDRFPSVSAFASAFNRAAFEDETAEGSQNSEFFTMPIRTAALPSSGLTPSRPSSTASIMGGATVGGGTAPLGTGSGAQAPSPSRPFTNPGSTGDGSIYAQPPTLAQPAPRSSLPLIVGGVIAALIVVIGAFALLNRPAEVTTVTARQTEAALLQTERALTPTSAPLVAVTDGVSRPTEPPTDVNAVAQLPTDAANLIIAAATDEATPTAVNTEVPVLTDAPTAVATETRANTATNTPANTAVSADTAVPTQATDAASTSALDPLSVETAEVQPLAIDVTDAPTRTRVPTDAASPQAQTPTLTRAIFFNSPIQTVSSTRVDTPVPSVTDTPDVPTPTPTDTIVPTDTPLPTATVRPLRISIGAFSFNPQTNELQFEVQRVGAGSIARYCIEIADADTGIPIDGEFGQFDILLDEQDNSLPVRVPVGAITASSWSIRVIAYDENDVELAASEPQEVTPPPTATPTDTAVPTATDTPFVPTATPTDTPPPTATDTPLPTATDTPLPTATDTPLPTATNTAVPTATFTASLTPTATHTPTLEPPLVVIDNIDRVGNIDGEQVEIVNLGRGVDLTGWTLRSSSGAEYTFPDGRTLFPSGGLILSTRTGDDTTLFIFWNREEAAFRPGDIVTLYDAEQQPQFVYEALAELPTYTPTTTATPTPTPTATGGAGIVIVNSGTQPINVRSGDATTFSAITTLGRGESATILGVSSRSSDWLQIELADGRVGWVSRTVIGFRGDVSTLPVIVPPSAPARAATATRSSSTQPTSPPAGQATAVPAGQATPAPVVGYNCVAFVHQSPRDGIANGTTTFYWTTVPGLNDYWISIFDDGGNLKLFADMGNQGSATLNTSRTSFNDTTSLYLSWEVSAFDAAGQVACSTGPLRILYAQ